MSIDGTSKLGATGHLVFWQQLLTGPSHFCKENVMCRLYSHHMAGKGRIILRWRSSIRGFVASLPRGDLLLCPNPLNEVVYGLDRGIWVLSEHVVKGCVNVIL